MNIENELEEIKQEIKALNFIQYQLIDSLKIENHAIKETNIILRNLIEAIRSKL